MAATSQDSTMASGPPPPPAPGRGPRKEAPRYRVTGDALPFPVALGVLVATAAAAMYLPRRWADLLALIGIGIAALAADYCISARGRATAVSVGACLAYVGIVADGDWMAGYWMPVPLLALGWLTLIIGFRPLLARAVAVRTLNRDQDARDNALLDDLVDKLVRRDERATNEGFRSIWPWIRHSCKLPEGSEYLGSRSTPRGGRISIRTSGDAASARAAGPTIAARVGVPRDAVTVTGDSQDNSVAHININLRDPLAEIVPWTPPATSGGDVRRGVHIARMADGSRAFLPLVETHVRITGKTRSGKTQSLSTILAEAIAMDNVVIVLIDVAKQGRDFVRFWPHVWMLARTGEEAVVALDRVLDAGAARLQRDTLTGVSGTHVPTRADPQYIVVIDEAPQAWSFDGKKGRPDVASRLLRLAQESSGWGNTLVVGVSNPHGDVMPTVARRQFGTKLSHQLDDDVAHKMAFDQAPLPGLNASVLPFQTGHALIMRNRDQRPAICRVRYADAETLDRWAASVPERDHVAPHPFLTLRPGPGTDPIEATHSPIVDDDDDVPEVEEVTYTGPHLVPDPDPGPDPANLRGSEADVYAAVAALVARGARPRQADVVTESKRSSKTVRKVLRSLVDAGYLIEEPVPGTTTANYYRPTRRAA